MNLPFIRTRTTWLGYNFLAYFTLSQALISAVMPFLRVEIGLSYTLTGLFLSVNALGMALAGLSADRLAARMGRKLVFWVGVGASLVGLVLLACGHQAPILLAGSLFAGYFGGMLQATIQAFLSDANPDTHNKGIALTEAGIAAGVGSFLAPLLVSLVIFINLGWRAAPTLVVCALLCASFAFRKTAIPPQKISAQTTGSSRLPGVYWVLWGVIFLSVAVEWCVIFWSADFLEKIVGVEKTLAAAAISGYFIAVIIGRFIGSRLVRRFRPLTLLLYVQALAGAGILVFLLVPGTLPKLVGLVMTGLGIASMYPLTSVEAIAAVPNATNLASARLTLAAGLAIFSAPLLMGWVADQIGIRSAYPIALLLVAAGFGMALLARQMLFAPAAKLSINLPD